MRRARRAQRLLQLIELARRSDSVADSKPSTSSKAEQGIKLDSAGEDLPATVGRFQIQRLLGQGGFGLVMLADDPQLQRQVAVKVPRPEVLISKELQHRHLRLAV